jgi:hypothetical protein
MTNTSLGSLSSSCFSKALPAPLRLGAGAQQLSENDITAIGKLMPDNKSRGCFRAISAKC